MHALSWLGAAKGSHAKRPGAALAARAPASWCVLAAPTCAVPTPALRHTRLLDPPLPLPRVAATLGWVALLRQLQPAGRSDFLLARVRLPASAVRDAHLAAQNTLLTSVTDGPLLPGIALGPRLSLRLQAGAGQPGGGGRGGALLQQVTAGRACSFC